MYAKNMYGTVGTVRTLAHVNLFQKRGSKIKLSSSVQGIGNIIVFFNVKYCHRDIQYLRGWSLPGRCIPTPKKKGRIIQPVIRCMHPITKRVQDFRHLWFNLLKS